MPPRLCLAEKKQVSFEQKHGSKAKKKKQAKAETNIGPGIQIPDGLKRKNLMSICCIASCCRNPEAGSTFEKNPCFTAEWPSKRPAHSHPWSSARSGGTLRPVSNLGNSPDRCLPSKHVQSAFGSNEFASRDRVCPCAEPSAPETNCMMP